MNAAFKLSRRFRADRSGVALIEFALTLPLFLLMLMGGAELANFITVKMRVSQLALTIADNAARMGAGSPLAAKQISEADINDVFIGGQLASSGLDLKTNGRVILSDLEPQSIPNNAGQYKIVWQRCYGKQTHPSTFGKEGDQNMAGMGPSGRLVTAQDDNATMFVEVYYVYKPLITGAWIPGTQMTEIASMTVRDRRDLTKVYNNEGVTAGSC